MLDAIFSVISWFFLISGVLAWVAVGIGFWFYNMDKRR